MLRPLSFLCVVWTATIFAQTPTNTAVTISAGSPRVGELVTLTATVSPSTTGVVEFVDDFRILGHAVLNGASQASLPIRFSVPRTYQIRAIYAGRTGFAASKSAVLNISVKQLPVISFNGTLLLPLAASTFFPDFRLKDVTRDGNEDFIATNVATSVYPGNGDGTFGAARVTPEFSARHFADFDSDGVTDALAPQPPSNSTYRLLKGAGNGTFTPGADLPGIAVETADYNRDGHADFVEGQFLSLTTTLYSVRHGRGDGSFSPTAPSSGFGAAIDLNLDETADSAYCYTTQGGRFDPFIRTCQTSLGTVLADGPALQDDLNGDGRDDLVFYSVNGPVQVSITAANGSSPAPVTVVPAVVFLVQLLDWNGDGKLDIIAQEAINRDGKAPYNLVAYAGNGDGTFGSKAILYGNSPASLFLLDVNNDGRLDIVADVNGIPAVILGSASPVSMSLLEPSIAFYNAGLEYSFAANFQIATGPGNLSKVFLRISPGGNANACLVEVTTAPVSVRLVSDSGAGLLPPGNPSNTQCWLRDAGASVTVSGNSLLVTLPITFNRGFIAPVTASLRAIQTDGSDTGYLAVRSIAPPPTSPLNVTPASGSGSAATFLAKYASYGTASLSLAYFLIGTSLNSAENCLVEFNAQTNQFRLASGSTFIGPLSGGGSGLSNGACTLKAGASATSSTSQPYRFTDVSIPLEFTSGFSGAKTVWMLSYAVDGSNSGWQSVGSFTVSGGVTPAGDPQVVSIVDGGAAFTATFSHPGGVNQLYLGYLLFLPTPNVVQYTAQGSCLVEYNRISNGFRLINDAGNGWLGGESGITAGTPGATLSNAACTINIAAATVSIGTTTLSYTIPVALKSAGMTPIPATFLQALDVTGKWTGMTQFGNRTVIDAMLQKPGPQIGGVSGPSEPNVGMLQGATGPLAQLHLRIASKIVGAPACHIVFFYDTNTVNMINDSETALVSPVNLAIGAPGSLANSRCSINAAQITRSDNAGQTSVWFKSLAYNSTAFSGTKTLYVQAFDGGGYTTHWFGAMNVSIP